MASWWNPNGLTGRDAIGAFRAANEQRAREVTELAALYKVAPMYISQIGQVYNSDFNAGRYTSSFEDYVHENFSRFDRGWPRTP